MKSSEKIPLLNQNESASFRGRRNQIIAVLGVTFTHFPTGNTTGYSSVTLPELTTDSSINPSEEDLSWIASLLTIGLMVGTVTGGLISEKLGRKLTIMLSSLIFSIGWVMIGQANSVWLIFAGRILTGMMAGVYSITVQVYICEIVDPSIRGISGSLPTLQVCLGVLATYTMGTFVNWRILAYISSGFPLLIFIFMIFLPESPVWLISKGRHSDALNALSWLIPESKSDVDEKFNNLKNKYFSETTKDDSLTKTGQLARFKDGAVLKPLLIGGGLFFFQKFCGVSAITFYAGIIFKYKDNSLDIYLQTNIMGIVRLLATFVGIFMVKKFNRKTLLISSGLIMFLSEGVLGTYYYFSQGDVTSSLLSLSGDNTTSVIENSVGGAGVGAGMLTYIQIICVTVFMFGTCIGFATIPWFLIAEMLPSDVRSLSCSIAFGFCQLCQFLSVKTYFDLVGAFGTYGTFWIYSGISGLGALFVIFLVPETSNLNSSQIEKLFDSNSKTVDYKSIEKESVSTFHARRDEENNVVDIEESVEHFGRSV